MHESAPLIFSIRLRKLTRIRQGEFPLTYLGCPVYYWRKNSGYFEGVMRKIARRILSWRNRFLSFGRRYILINHELLSMPMYLLTSLTPPKGVTRKLHQMLVEFFWGSTTTEKRKHWVAWEDMCFLREEGGLGFKSLLEMNRAMQAKL